MTDGDLDLLFAAAQADSKCIKPLLLKLQGLKAADFTDEIEAKLVALVPQMVAALSSDADNVSRLCCLALGRLGRKAEAAIPALFEHAEREPRLELNVLAIGKIGGPGVVRRLMEWTFWSGANHDRKRTDAACSAIKMLGEQAITELLEIAGSETEDSHQRSRAILNLYYHTDYPPKQLIPIIIQEMERADCYLQCLEALSEVMIRIGAEFPTDLIEQIESASSFLSNWDYLERYVDILSEMGDPAVPTLVQALERDDRENGTQEIMQALSRIGGLGLEYLLKTVSDSSRMTHRSLALWIIPARGRDFLATLTELIQRRGESDRLDSLVQQAVLRLGDFVDELEPVERLLRALTGHPDVDVANAAHRSLMQIQSRQRNGHA